MDRTGQGAGDGHTFGQRQPPLYVTIGKILDKYPDGQIFKEIIQNADDAGASTVHFYLDNRQHGTTSLIHPTLGKFQGPSLLAYNDAVFQEKDWQSIQDMQQSVKAEDPFKVGKFGIGFNSVYHITDLPTIISGNRLAYLDPHEEIWPRETGQWYDIDKHTYTVDTFAPFEGLCGFSAHVGSYNGTLFRFPLRNEQRDKRVSKHIYDVNKLRSLLRALQEEAKCILLFLRSVRTLEVFEISRSGNHSNLMKMSICETSGDGLGPKRQRFQENLEMLFEAQSFGIREKLSQIVHVQVDVNDYQQGTEGSSKWLVANQVGSQSAEVRKLANTLKVFPWVGVALETSADELEKSGGRVFCVLPMPQDVSCYLPVHVNGTFSLNDERRELKWCGVERKNDPSAQWNHRLVEELLPPCYASLLLGHAQILLKPDQFCRAWPNTRRVKGTHWEGLLKPLLTALFAQRVIPFCKPGGLGAVTWVKVSSATFVPRGSTLPGVVSTALVACGVKLVTVSEEVWNALDHCRISVTSVTPSLTRSELKKSSHSYNGFSSAQKLELLRYCLSDNAYGDMHNLELLPLVNGNFGTFATPFSALVYLCTLQCPHYLLPSLEGELVNEKIETQLYMKLKTIAQGRNTNLHILTVNNVAALLPRAMPQEWQYQNTVTVSYSNFNMQWLQRFWQWVTGGNLYLFANQLLVPVSDTNVTRLSKSSPTLFIPSTANCSQYLVSALEKLQVQCCEQKRHQFVQHNSYICQHMNYFSPDGIIDVISCASPYYGNLSFTAQEARELIMHVHRVTLNPQRQITLRNIPMFATMKNTNESLYSVEQVECSTGRMPQMEPPSFPLNPKNIPSTVVLFSHSNNYQRILLQGLSVQHTTTVDLLMYNLFPLIETGSMGRNAAKSLMTEVLEKFNDITSRTASQKKVDFQNAIARLSFVPVSVGKPKAPNTLYSPDIELKNLFYQEPVFPLEPFSTGMCLNVLKRCGLKTTVSTQEIIDIIESISSPANTDPVPVDEVKHKRARAILSYIRSWGRQLSECVCIPGQPSHYFRSNLNFSAALKELSMTKSWLPVHCSPPTGYPSCLTWKGSGYTSHFVSYGPSVLLSRDQSSLAIACGSQMYFVEHSLQQALCKEFTPEPEEMVRHIMAHLEQVILNHQQLSRVEEVRKTTQVIYQLLSKYHTEGAGVDLSLLEATDDCVWLTKQKKFVHPTIIALEQNSTFRQNLEPFIYILPDDLAEHESLFKALGVQQAVTKPQILGILEKIRDGDSQSLCVSSHQAWSMVMTILNWLTGNGEHDVHDEDVELLLVPVDPDTDWPMLVKVDDDVVYTDSDFLQRFLEGSNEGESEYTFVNHRVSSRLAHQLHLTPLSKYLNISEDAFEDVGQSEPLTVRLKNILKDYKDGLTIIKELLQNADDAEASEMNICYDARCHTDKRQSLFFPGMAECHGPALIVNNDAMFSKEDFQNITKLAGATKEGKVLKIGKFGVGFCSVYHITDIPSFVSNDLLYIFDPTLTYLKDEIKNPARPGKKLQFTSNFISRSNQLAPYIGLFEFNPRSRYKGTTFRFPFRKAASELSGKIYGEGDVKTLMEQIQKSSSKLLLFLQHVKLVTFSQINSGQASQREIMRITKAKETITGNRCVHQVTHSVNGSPDTTEFWMIETCTATILEKYSTASVACALSPLSDRGIYKPKQVEGEVFCFLPLSKKTGLPVHVSSNFAVSNNRTGIWTSDDTSKESSNEVQWNESLMKGVICSAYCELLEGLKELHSDSKLSEYDFFSMWPVVRELQVVNPWCHCVEAVYDEIVGRELFFSLSTDKWLTLDESTFLHPDILKVPHSPSFPRPVLDVVNHLELPVVHLPQKYHDHLDITGSTETEEAFLEHFFRNIDELRVIKESRNGVLCLTLECYAHELNQNDEERFDYLHRFLHENDCIPCEPNGVVLKQPNEVIHSCAYFAKLYDIDENIFSLKTFCSKKLVEQAMKELGILYDSIPLQNLEERATGIATIYENDQLKAMERAKLITECLDKYKGFSTEDCAELAGIAFLPVVSKPTDYPLPWKGEDDRLYAGAEIVLKGVHVFQIKEDYTNMNIAGSQVVFLNQDLPCDGGCGRLAPRVREMLQIRESPSYAEVISHYQLLIETFDSDSPRMIKWANRISRKVYEYLDQLLKSVNFQESEEMQGTLSALAERACIWTEESFVEISVVAKDWKLKGPYLHSVPESMVTRKSLQKSLGIREHFTTDDYIHALQCLKGDYGVNPLPHNCQILVRAIVLELPTTESDNDYGSVMLPDSKFVMQEATKLYYNDMPWQPPDEEYVFVHERVPLATAKVLGVQLCRTASLARYLLPGSCFTVVEFGQHEKLTRRIQNIIRDYPFDMTILKELLQNADDAKATKMHVILDMREHSKEHVLSEKWSDDLQGPALLVWNDSVFSEEDLKGIQKLGLGSKRSDSETIGQYGIGFNAVYHLTDCPSFLSGGNTLCILDPHMRYVPQATDRHPGAMYQNLDDSFWKSFDGLKSLYLRGGVPNAPKELLGGSLFRFPLRHTLSLVKSSDIVKDIDNKTLDRVLSGQKMCTLLAEWAPHMKQSLLFLNNVTELKFFVITDRRGVLKLQNSYRTELTENAVQHRSELTKMIKSFNDADSRKPFITTYPLTIVESDMNRGKDRHEEWLIQQGTGDIENNVNTWSYVEQVKPRHGIAAPMRHDKVSWVGQVFCFLPLPLFSKLPVHINGHFILNSTRRNLWVATDLERGDDKSHWNENLLKAIASSYAHFLERIPEYFTDLEGCCTREAFENATEHYYINFPRKNKEPISEPWLQLINDVFKIMKRRNSPVLAVPTNKSSRSSEDKYLLQWQTLRSEKMPASQAYFWEKMGGGKKQVSKMRSIFERIGMKITCAPMWVMRHFKHVECEIPVISRVSVYKFYTDYNQRFISNCFPRDIHDTPFKSVEDFKLFTEFLLETTTEPMTLKKQAVFPQQPFGYPLLLTADNQLRVFDQANKVLCSKHANMFPKCPQSFLHKDLIGCSYSMSYFVSELDHKAVRVKIVKELLETVLPRELKNMYVSAECEAVEKVDIKGLWNCFKDDEVFKSVLDEVLKVWALLLTRDNRLFRCTSSEQLLPIIPAEGMTTSLADVSYVLEKELQGPFLDTAVVPVEIVKTFCPTLSDHKAMLRNLFYLHREQPFTEKVSVHSAGILVSYFANIHFKNEPNCCYTLKYLPLFETIDGKLTILEGKRVYVWPTNICQEGNEKWLKGTNLIFLKGWAAWRKLGIDFELGIKRITAEETYIQFIFPNFFKMSKQERYLHLKYIRDYLFKTNFVNQQNRPAFHFVEGLKNLHCIGEDGSTLQLISSFCTHEKTIFRTFPEHFPTLPEDFLQRDERKWMTFFQQLGLQETVTARVFVCLCNDVANGKLGENTETASKVLLDYLFSIEENKHHGFHNDAQLLAQISNIAFVCPTPMPELEWIHKAPQTPNRVIVSSTKDIPLCKLSGSCSKKHKDILWMVKPIVSVSESNEKLLQQLQLCIQPNVRDVIMGIKALSKTHFADSTLFTKYTVPHRKPSQTELTTVMIRIFEYLHSTTGDVRELKALPCIPVFALSVKDSGQYPVLVKPHCVVFRPTKETKPYYPFLHSAHNLYRIKELLEKVGVQDSVKLRHMQIVLESVFEETGDMELDPNTKTVVSSAVHQIKCLLTSNKEDRRSQMGERALAEQLEPLYLSGTDKRMHPVDSLVYCPGMKRNNIDLTGTDLFLLWTPMKYDVYPEKFCEMLPKAVRPRPLSQLCIKKVSSSCKVCEMTPPVIEIQKTLQFPQLPHVMSMSVKSFTSSATPSESVQDVFEEHVTTIFDSLEIRCTERLKIDICLKNEDSTQIGSESVRSFIQKEKKSYYLYIDSKIPHLLLFEVHECIIEELVSCLRTILGESDINDFSKFLKTLLTKTNPEEMLHHLQDHEISYRGLEFVDYGEEPILGAPLPKLWHIRLDMSSQNIFQSQEWVAYRPDIDKDTEYVFAQISHPVNLKDPSGQPLTPMEMEYVIFVSEDDTKGLNVKAIDLFKFTRGEKAPVDSAPVESESLEIVPFEGDPEKTSPPPAPINVQQAKEEVRKELEEIWRLPKDDHRKAIHRLYLKWHPDKNPDYPELAEEVFKFLQEQLDRHEKGVRVSGSASPTPHRSWRTYQRSWDYTARQHRQYREWHEQSSSSSETAGAEGSTGSSHQRQRRRGQSGGGSTFNFTPPKNDQEARRWVRQAVVDCKILKAVFDKARTDVQLSCHVCFMAHEVAEKALKGTMYATCGLRENSRRNHNIIPLANSIELARPIHAGGLSTLAAPLEPTYYEDTRFPKESSPSSVPFENFSLDDAVSAAECAEAILKIARDIVNVDI